MGGAPQEDPCLVFPGGESYIHWCVQQQLCQCPCPHMTATTIAIIQNIILFLLGIPAYIAVFQEPESLSTSDYVLGALAVIDLVFEFVADNQQYSFQTYKHTGVIEKNEWPGANIQWTPADAKRGFVTRGLWAWSRHPNFLCEQSFWVGSHSCTTHLVKLTTLPRRSS